MHTSNQTDNSLQDLQFQSGGILWIVNSQGQYLLSQRHPQKTYPLCWECTGGSVLAGEDSLNGVMREVRGELEIMLNPFKAEMIYHTRREEVQDFYDVWLFHADIDISEIKMQETEVISVQWVSRIFYLI